MLERSELTLDGSALAVKVVVALRFAWDERVKPACLAPHRAGLALASRAAPLGRLSLEVGTSEGPLAVRAVRRVGSATLHGSGFLQGDDRRDAPVHSPCVDGTTVVRLIHDRDLGIEALASAGVLASCQSTLPARRAIQDQVQPLLRRSP